MGIKPFIYFRCYAIPGRRLHTLACSLQRRQLQGLSQSLQNMKTWMNERNKERRETQRQIVALCSQVEICQDCDGLCCRGDYDHFTPIDYVFRMFSDNPLRSYGVSLRERPWHLVLRERLHNFLCRIDEYDHRKQDKPNAGRLTRCRDWTATGCRFSPEDRPVRCVMWTCPAFREHLSLDDFREIGKLNRRLWSLCDEMSRVIRHEQDAK